MTKLTEYSKGDLGAGTILRFVGEYPFHDDPVDFMICDYPSASEGRCAFALYCVSGYHAGSLEYVFPKEAQAEGARAVSSKWLKENWQKKVYGGCTADNVTVTGYAEGECL